jgi:hypothetical protein
VKGSNINSKPKNGFTPLPNDECLFKDIKVVVIPQDN